MGRRTLIFSWSVNLIVYQSIFKNNFVYKFTFDRDKDGGGAISHSGGNLTILKSNFTNNEITNNFNGEAIYFSGWRGIKITDCHFSGNRASANGGAVYIGGGGGITITNTIFTNNTMVEQFTLVEVEA